MDGTGDVVEVGFSKPRIIGRVEDFLSRKSVVIFTPREPLKLGDRIKIIGNPGTGISFEQDVTSIQKEHEAIEEAQPGEQIGLHVDHEARKNCCIIKL